MYFWITPLAAGLFAALAVVAFRKADSVSKSSAGSGLWLTAAGGSLVLTVVTGAMWGAMLHDRAECGALW